MSCGSVIRKLAGVQRKLKSERVTCSTNMITRGTKGVMVVYEIYCENEPSINSLL